VFIVSFFSEHTRDFVGALLNNFPAIFFQSGMNERPGRKQRLAKIHEQFAKQAERAYVLLEQVETLNSDLRNWNSRWRGREGDSRKHTKSFAPLAEGMFN
jgi:hypothetical protein